MQPLWCSATRAGQQWQLQYKAFDAFMRLSFDMSFVEAFMAAERGTSLTEPASGASSVRKDFSGMAGLTAAEQFRDVFRWLHGSQIKLTKVKSRLPSRRFRPRDR